MSECRVSEQVVIIIFLLFVSLWNLLKLAGHPEDSLPVSYPVNVVQRPVSSNATSEQCELLLQYVCSPLMWKIRHESLYLLLLLLVKILYPAACAQNRQGGIMFKQAYMLHEYLIFHFIHKRYRFGVTNMIVTAVFVLTPSVGYCGRRK